MSYVPNTDDDRRKMLEKIGVEKIEDLFDGIPDKLRLQRPLNIEAQSEMELLADVQELVSQNKDSIISFAGGGVYDHFVPAALESIINRPEFMTAYTPYQAEVAQGTLQAIYEFQSHICRLTGMDAANASMYDGASAAAEAILMAMNLTKRNKVVISETLNPHFRQVIDTYLCGRDIEIVYLPIKDGYTDFEKMADVIDENTAALLLAQPNFFGMLEDIPKAVGLIHSVKGKLILSVDPIAQVLLKTPSEYNVDIVVGEGQPLGLHMNFGGPLLGFFAAKKELIRYMPGRIAARTKDVDGKEGFVLTLQTREQHIRREKATSNICTNQALCATAATIYMTLLGREGLKEVALHSASKAKDVAQQIFEIEGYEPYFEGPFLREFAVKTPVPASQIIFELVKDGILAGIDAGRWYSGLDDCLIIALTEKRTEKDIDKLVNKLKGLVKSGVLSSL